MKHVTYSILGLALATTLTVPSLAFILNENSLIHTLSPINLQTAGTFSSDSLLPNFKSLEKPDSVVTPQTQDNQWNYTDMSNGTNNFPTFFVVPPGYGHTNLYFVNKGTADIDITVQHHDTGKEYICAVLAPGKALSWKSTNKYSHGIYSGFYDVTIHSASSKVKIDFAGWISDTKDEATNKQQ